MKIPLTAKEVEDEILLSSDNARHLGDLRIRQLIALLKKVDSEIVVDGVLRVFENDTRPENYSTDQEFAGRVLNEVKPFSQSDLKRALLRVLNNWDKSVEQFPFWLRDNYGIDQMAEVFKKIELTEKEADKLTTLKWWLQMT